VESFEATDSGGDTNGVEGTTSGGGEVGMIVEVGSTGRGVGVTTGVKGAGVGSIPGDGGVVTTGEGGVEGAGVGSIPGDGGVITTGEGGGVDGVTAGGVGGG
jgi:hypothetical protein